MTTAQRRKLVREFIALTLEHQSTAKLRQEMEVQEQALSNKVYELRKQLDTLPEGIYRDTNGPSCGFRAVVVVKDRYPVILRVES